MQNPRSFFLGHGAPTLALSTHPAAGFLRELGRSLPRPRAAIVISPHRAAGGFDVGAAAAYSAWHDFRGFDPALYQLRYDVPGDPVLARQVVEAIQTHGHASRTTTDTRIDHGIWVPLRLMWPDADVPVVPIATDGSGPTAHLDLGKALRPFTQDRILVIGSGSLVHNLCEVRFDGEFDPPAAWAQEFDDWLAERLVAADHDSLCDYRNRAPHARRAHPDDDHLMPLFTAMGAGGPAKRIFQGFSHGSISLSAYAFQ